jgi:hypothetical protein
VTEQQIAELHVIVEMQAVTIKAQKLLIEAQKTMLEAAMERLRLQKPKPAKKLNMRIYGVTDGLSCRYR